MSLRGSETTEAISQCPENKEIAALPSVARNDKARIATQFPRGEGRVIKVVTKKRCLWKIKIACLRKKILVSIISKSGKWNVEGEKI